MIPKTLKKKAEHVRKFLETCNGIKWNENTGQVIFYGFPEAGTHIAELVGYLLRPASSVPTGFETFVRIIADNKIPPYLIGNTSVKKAVIQLQTVERATTTTPKHHTPKNKSKVKSRIQFGDLSSTTPVGKIGEEEEAEENSEHVGFGKRRKMRRKSKSSNRKVKVCRWKTFK